MADLLAASLAALSSELFTLRPRCFFQPRPDDLSNLWLIKPRLFLLDDVSGGRRSPLPTGEPPRTASSRGLLVQRTHVQTVKGGNSRPCHLAGMRLSHRDLYHKRQAALFTGCVWGSSSFDRPFWTKDHYPAKKKKWEDGDMLFPDHSPWSVTALAGRPHKNVRPGRTVGAVEGLVGCPDGSSLARTKRAVLFQAETGCRGTWSPLEVLGGWR